MPGPGDPPLDPGTVALHARGRRPLPRAGGHRGRGGRRVELAIVDGDDRLLGSIAIARSIDGRAGEVGYWIARDARRRGVATRAVELLSTWAFSELGLERIELLAEPGNTASQRVAEAAGFTKERLLPAHREQKGRMRDFFLYVLVPGSV